VNMEDSKSLNIGNVYFEEFNDVLHDGRFLERSQYQGWPPPSAAVFTARSFLVKKYGWSVLTDQNYMDIYNAMKDNVPANRNQIHMVSMGAGSGYHEMIFRNLGVDVLAVDKETPDYHFLNKYTYVRTEESGVLVEVSEYDVLFLSWPNYNTSFASDCLDIFRGRMVVYIGEGKYGCTGDDEFHDKLDNDFILQDCIDNPRYYGLNDRIHIYTRKPAITYDPWF